MAIQDSLKKLEEKFEAIVKDVTTLTVRTFAGDVTGQWTGGDFKLSNLDQVKLVAMTTLKLDGDTDVVIPKKPEGGVDKEVFDIHNGAVAAASAARAAMIKGIGDVLRGLGG